MTTRVSIQHITLPGHRAPAAGFDAPFDMLGACHERVARTLALLERLRSHLAAKGCDVAANDAARDVMRYFDVAAPRHHEDEELHVFPPLLADPHSGLHQVVQRLQQEHVAMELAWRTARQALARVRDAVHPTEGFALTQAEQQALDLFAGLYARHMDDEDTLVYPATQQRLSADQLQAMGDDMMVRRTVQPPGVEAGVQLAAQKP